MSEELKIIANEDGTFSEYDDTFDITIHCQSEEEQNEVLAKLNAPQPKIGWWKAYTHSAYHGNDENDEPIWREVVVYHCSECNRRTVIKENYCPNCGAKMVEPQESEVEECP